MKLTYTVQVCNESRELYSLLNFLSKTVDDGDEVNVVVDSNNVTDKVERVLEHFKQRITVFKRPFDSFYLNSQFHADQASGDYVFLIDADEMPQELLIKKLKDIIKNAGAEIIAVPRINIHPGATQEFIEKSKFTVNDAGFINWPDYQTRVFKNCEHIRWTDEVHTKLTGTDKIVGIRAEPKMALWHIKSIEKQESRWDDSGGFKTPNGSLYDLLM